MNKKKRSSQINRGERARLKKLKEQARAEEDGVEEEEIPAPPSDEVVSVEKEYDSPMEMAWRGPTSFEELDALEEAQERADQVREVTWNVQDLVRNILHDPLIDQGAKAGKIIAVANGFEERVSKLMAEDMQKDIEVLQIEAILAAETRERDRHPFQKAREHVVEFFKEKLSTEARKKLPAAEFALPEQKKYPIHDKAHVRNALARAAQQIEEGGEGAADAKAALPKIRAAAKKFGITVSMEKGIHIEKDAQGNWRWLGRPSNNFIDWQTDIVSKSAHEKYVAWLDDNPDMAPVFVKWHTPGTAREHPVDFWMEHEGTLILSGRLTEEEAAQLFHVQKMEDLGMSVQGTGMRLDPSDRRVITDYWLFEVSDLPLEKAANPFTSLAVLKEADMDKLKYLTEIYGGDEEKAKTFLKKTGDMQKQLQAAGITSKEKPDESVTETKPASTQVVNVSAPPDAAALIKQAVEQVAKEYDFEGLNEAVTTLLESAEKVEMLEALVKELKQSDDQKLATQLNAPINRFAWARQNRPSQSAESKLKKGDEEEGEEDEDEVDELLKGSTPHWLSEVTKTAPIPQEV